MQIAINLKEPHDEQKRFIYSEAKRRCIRAGRRGGKTVGVAILAVIKLLQGRRVLYATPTQTQIGKFWWEVTTAMKPAIEAGLYRKNETEKFIVPSHGESEARIKAKTAWNADTLRGDFADLLILDEFQLMDPDAWSLVGAPMLLDNDGDAVFIYTSEQRAVHASEMYRRAKNLQEEAEERGEQARWAAFHFTSYDNPHISKVALEEIKEDMSDLAIRLEIFAEDLDDDPRALWTRDMIKETRVLRHPPLTRIVVGIDPQGGMSGETGIIISGTSDDTNGDLHGYLLDDDSINGSPAEWATKAVVAYHKWEADLIVAERNFGGDMVENTIKSVDPRVPVKLVTASRGKMVRAEPIATLMSKGRIHHVGEFPALEDELCLGGDTAIITRDGPLKLGDLVDRDVVVLGGNGEWQAATGHYFGKQETYEITISRYGVEQQLIATNNHNWFADKTPRGAKHSSNNVKKTKTRELVCGDYLMGRKRRTLLSHARIEPIGVMAGFVYGDGWKLNSSTNSGCGVAFFEHDHDVISWFGPNAQERLRPFKNNLGTNGQKLYGIPLFLKDAPDYMESASFLYGWLAGYFAADGHINEKAQCVLSSTSRTSLEIARHVATILGIQTGCITTTKRKDFGILNGRYAGNGIIYKLCLTASCLRKEFFIKTADREKWERASKRGFKKSIIRWKVEHIESAHIQDVFCLHVPQDHRFVLAETNIISGNCQYVKMLNRSQPSPNRYDAYNWAFTDLMLEYCMTELGTVEIPMV